MNPLMVSYVAQEKHKDYERQFRNRLAQEQDDAQPRPSLWQKASSWLQARRAQPQAQAARQPSINECFDPMPVQPCPDAA